MTLCDVAAHEVLCPSSSAVHTDARYSLQPSAEFIFRVDGPVKNKSGATSRTGLARFIVEEGVKPEFIHKLVSIASS